MGTLQADGAEDRALPGGNLSADSRAKTRLGFGLQAEPQHTIDHELGLALTAINPRGLGTESPETSLLLTTDSFVCSALTRPSALSSDASLRPQLLHEPYPRTGCRNQYSASKASALTALTRASTKEPAAPRADLDKLLAWSAPTTPPRPSGAPQPQPLSDDSFCV